LLGFHATRLLAQEIEEIKQCGLEPLSIELLQRRLAAAQTFGALTADEAARLSARHRAIDHNRSGRTAFFFTRGQLKDAGLDRLCRFWGGEALYWSHENDARTGPLLRRLGIPCIVFAAVKVADIEPRFEIHYRLVNAWCGHRNIRTEHQPEFGGVVRTPQNVLKIVTLGVADIAAMAGVARENVSRVMSEWRRRNLITGSPRYYCLNDIAALTREVQCTSD
jgi:CRP-like cAMP-binding protein